MNKIIATLMLAMFLPVGANASLLTLNAIPSSVEPNDSFQVQIIGDFESNGFIAGGIQLIYDPVLVQLDSFITPLNVIPEFSCPGSLFCPVDPPGTLGIAWGQFLSDLIAPDAGPTLMATLEFTALAEGDAAFSMLDFSPIAGGWFGAGFGPIQTPDLSLGTEVQITTLNGQIPEPGTLALLGLGLAGLGFARRKKV